jgi:molybdopterin/thiamine biosynthesis adenylyltransferase
MSHALVNRSPDLKRLRDEGYAIEVIKPAYLVVRNVPYMNSSREIKYGILVSELTLAGDVTTKPETHVIYFAGEQPCHKDGTMIVQLVHQNNSQKLGGIDVQRSFSNKPRPTGYNDYYEKISTYVKVISSPAQSSDHNVHAQTFSVIETAEEESVFRYLDTASSRAGIDEVTKKLEVGKIAVIGVGGTGSYVLDLVAKTPPREIHIFDGDKQLQHNAFRAPGAPSLDELKKQVPKVQYFAEIYSRMRRNIFAHNCFIDASNVDQLKGMNFVFVCIDKGSVKKLIIEELEEWDIPFIDVGMGVEKVDTGLTGILRVTTSTPDYKGHVQKRVSFDENDPEGIYDQNIQLADLNALNAALAVIKWKKILGFYHDAEKEHNSTYSINCNLLTSDERPESPEFDAHEEKVEA